MPKKCEDTEDEHAAIRENRSQSCLAIGFRAVRFRASCTLVIDVLTPDGKHREQCGYRQQGNKEEYRARRISIPYKAHRDGRKDIPCRGKPGIPSRSCAQT